MKSKAERTVRQHAGDGDAPAPQGRALQLVVAVMVAVLVVMVSATAAAQDAQRIQSAWGTGNNATATFPDQPEEGNLLVAISFHRVNWPHAEMINDGWVRVVNIYDAVDDSGARRGLAVWYKHADTDEDQTVEVNWHDDEHNTGRDYLLVVHEFSGHWFYDDVAWNTSGGNAVTSLHTGTVEDPRTEESFVLGVYGQRYYGQEATWSNMDLEDNHRAYTSNIGDGYPVTVQDAYTTVDQFGEWESTVDWIEDANEALAALLVFSRATETTGDWYFNADRCGGKEEVDINDPPQPNAPVMLDQSGSMGSNTGPNDDESLWWHAQQAFDGALGDMDDDVRFGFGLFPAENCGPDGSGNFDCDRNQSAEMALESDYQNHTPIMSKLDDLYPQGGTPTWEAMYTLSESDSLNDPDYVGAGVMITDGQPCCDDDSKDQAIQATCQGRDDGYTNFIVGLGGATDQNFNNLQAAAAGTGCCGANVDSIDDCPEDYNMMEQDPCNDWTSIDDQNCVGSYQAYDATGLRNALIEISQEMMCTLPLDDSGWEYGVPHDPGAIKVMLDGDQQRQVPHVTEPGAMSGGDGCADDDHYCHAGFCRDSSEPKACDNDGDCDSGEYCHEQLGCQDGGDACSITSHCESDEFCWYEKCVSDDYACSSHADCEQEFNADYACHDGYCRDTTDGWCPHDDDNWSCDDPDDWCHEKLGCIDNSYCLDDSECGGGEICWLGACVDADEDMQCDGLGGWRFADQERQHVELTGYYCDQVQFQRDVETATTEVACSCSALYEGEACPIWNYRNSSGPIQGGCPAGEYRCASELDQDPHCDPSSGAPGQGGDDPGVGGPHEECPFACDDQLEEQPCIEGCSVFWDWLTDEVLVWCEDGRTIDDIDFDDVNRCEAGHGVVSCTDDGWVECTEGQIMRPMPELCDGLDNSCDGQVDNIEETWEQWRNREGPWNPDESDYWTEEDLAEIEFYFGENYGAFEMEDAGGDYSEGAACYEQNMCTAHACDMQHYLPPNADATVLEEFQGYIQHWSGGFDGCQCGVD